MAATSPGSCSTPASRSRCWPWSMCYSTDGSGLELIKAFEKWGETMGASAVVIHDYHGGDRLGKVLQRRAGYKPLGSALSKFTRSN